MKNIIIAFSQLTPMKILGTLFIFFSPTLLCQAETLKQEMTVTLETAEGETLDIGKINFSPTDSGFEYAVTLDDEKFSDEFLSMRPFKCLQKPGVMVCHMAYPYENKNVISTDNLMSLEYDFMFLHKTPEEYGINAWNGLYYKMQYVDGKIDGVLKEVDLNVLAAPPEDGVLRPVTYDMLHTAEPSIHWFPKLTIH